MKSHLICNRSTLLHTNRPPNVTFHCIANQPNNILLPFTAKFDTRHNMPTTSKKMATRATMHGYHCIQLPSKRLAHDQPWYTPTGLRWATPNPGTIHSLNHCQPNQNALGIEWPYQMAQGQQRFISGQPWHLVLCLKGNYYPVHGCNQFGWHVFKLNRLSSNN